MGGYAKVWVDLLGDPWAQGLSLSEKGAWLMLIVLAKNFGDEGEFCVQSWRALGLFLGCNRATAKKIVTDFGQEGKLSHVENANGTIKIAIRKYHYYQVVKRPGRENGVSRDGAVFGQSGSAQTRPDHTRAEQIRQEQTKPNQTSSHQAGPGRRASAEPGPKRADGSIDGGVPQSPPAARAASHLPPPRRGGPLVQIGDQLVLNAFYGKFGKNLNAENFKTLLRGNDTFAGYGRSARLLFAIANVKVQDGGSIENPVGLLIDFHGNPGKYLPDFLLRVWEGMDKFADAKKDAPKPSG